MAGRYDCDVLFIALKRLGKSEGEAEAILVEVDSKGFGDLSMGFASALELKRQFNGQHGSYNVSTYGGEHAGGWIMVHIVSRCVQPGAPWVKCCVDGIEVKTCDRKKPVDNNYCCPVHNQGSQLCDGQWVCSPECWEIATQQVI